MALSIQGMTEDVLRIFSKYTSTGTNPWDYKVAAFDLQYQLGNLSKRISQLDNNRYNEGLSPEKIKACIADEIADIMAEALFIAHELDIDVEKGWRAMITSDETKIKNRQSDSE